MKINHKGVEIKCGAWQTVLGWQGYADLLGNQITTEARYKTRYFAKKAAAKLAREKIEKKIKRCY